MKILILGVNGFIGHSLTNRILSETDWEIFGIDLGTDRIAEHLDHPRFHFFEGDISVDRGWVDRHVMACDVVLPLVAIATPRDYVQHPLRVFELDFEENLRIVRSAVRCGTRVVFPSTSEVYGMCDERAFSEEQSHLVLGPIRKERWIYACSKQLLDRVIYAYGHEHGLRFTLFRPFNWVGPNLDDVAAAKEGSSRVVTQFLGHLMRDEPVRLVDGGAQRRCITDIRDGIDALMRILRNEGGGADGRIFNIGNPHNECSIAQLATLLTEILSHYEPWASIESTAVIEKVSAEEYYGPGYQDISARVPDITNARKHLGWEPRYDLREALAHTVHYYAGGGASCRSRRPR